MACVQCGQNEAIENVKGFISRVCKECKIKFDKHDKSKKENENNNKKC